MDDEQKIRSQVEKYIKNRNEFYIHLAVYIAVHVFLWAIWFFTNRSVTEVVEIPFPWPLIPMFGWGIGLVSHGLSVYFSSPARIAAREAEIDREVERLSGRKPKRDARYTLSDDGEVIEFEGEEAENEPKRKRQR